MKRLNELSVLEVLEGLKNKKFTSSEVTKACLNKIRETDTKINAFVTVTEELALKQALDADSKIAKDGSKAFDKHKLLGVPYACKDNFCTKGVLTTASSNVIKNFIPPYESTVTQKLIDAGVVLLGKTNMDAFAHGSSTETSDFFTTKNPKDLSRVAGGSSGGSAAAVADNMCSFAIGSETAGSIRIPASWCGVVGLKPTYGRVSRYGVIAMASSTDSPGPITKTVDDAALVLEIISGKDDMDATSSSNKVLDYLNLPVDKTLPKIGIAKSYFVQGMEEGVKDAVLGAIGKLSDSGFKTSDINLMDPKYSIAVYTIIQRSEVSSNLARFDGIRYGFDRSEFGQEAKKRIMLGTYALSAGYYDQYYLKAQKVRTLIIQDFKRAFESCDVIAAPVVPSVALKIGASKDSAMFGELTDQLNEPSALAGLCAITIPCGISNGLPVGIQFMAKQFNEDKLISVAKSLEKLLKD